MRIIRTVHEVRVAVAEARAAGRIVGLVPTMGAFHAGHLSLMQVARTQTDLVVVSLFVNPTQFAAGEDLSAYPRDEQRDADMARGEGVDILFAPEPAEVYPDGFSTTIHVSSITDVLCGATRGPQHFDGVATVVAKMLGMVAPDVAFFGQKDAQQVLVVRRLVRDLDIPVRIEACPIVREPDGLAMSSRNVYLDPAARVQATALQRALAAADAAAKAGERDAAVLVAAAAAVLADAGIEPEYLELRATDDLRLLDRVEEEGLLAVAARVGGARLIDNCVLRPN
ncbi:pantoate--beta-alanine ligase [Microbacterium sp. bgisy189]|uniref:pantoate--beta-alanine ligase n=1 Tax=Microbacterium sp. bgisy189 TaxID=3413798 RepID=UPI003EBAAA7E